jgi:competence protein ComEC
MFSWSPFPFLRIALWFIVGLIIYDRGLIETKVMTVLWMAALSLFAISIYTKRILLSGVAGTIVLIGLGVFHMYYSDPVNMHNHISKRTFVQMDGFVGEVTGDEVEKGKYFRYDLHVDHLIDGDEIMDVSGLIHLYLYKSDSVRLTTGSRVYVDYFFSEIPQPKNPAEFNYSQYIKRSGIYGQSFVKSDKLRVTRVGKQADVFSKIRSWRRRSMQVLSEVISDPRELQIADALILGVKDYLDREVKTAYASVGAMHVLAVSGLHVGIIYMIILHLLKPLRLLPYGSYVVFAGVILCIWLYAMLTGSSPSVMRAATMFSVISLKEISIKKANIYNSLGLAAIVILLLKPQYLFAVGFQLSFIAVFGIVHLYPIIYNALKLDNWLLDKIWSISSISIAAQLATFPLSMYYFHQFPVYFLVSNLFVIPGATILLVLGLVTIVTGMIYPSLALIPGYLLDRSIYLLNEAVFLVDQLPHSLVTGLYITKVEVWLCYGVIILFFAALQYRSFTSIVVASCFLLLQLSSVYYRNWLATFQRQVVFYEIPDKTAIDFIDGKHSKLLISRYEPAELELLSFQMDPYRRTANLTSIIDDIESWDQSDLVDQNEYYSMICWQGIRILILDKPLARNHNIQGKIAADVLLLANDAIRNIAGLPSEIEANVIMISSDYSPHLVSRLLYQAKGQDIEIHSLSKDGYWLLDLNKIQKL